VLIYSLASVVVEFLSINFLYSPNKCFKTNLEPMLPSGYRTGNIFILIATTEKPWSDDVDVCSKT